MLATKSRPASPEISRKRWGVAPVNFGDPSKERAPIDRSMSSVGTVIKAARVTTWKKKINQSHLTTRKYSVSAPARKFGPANPLPIYHLLPTSSAFPYPQFQHTLDLVHPSPPHQKKPLAFFGLHPSFLARHPPHKRTL